MRQAPDKRKEGLLRAGADAAVKHGFFKMTADQVATIANVARPLINHYFSNMDYYKGEVVKYAVKNELLEVLAQVVTGRDRGLKGMIPVALARRALADAGFL